jgi:transcriptional regulator with GAF, ATPase, and Fis domain/tetratricopeptide (TPR) repeat protein/serine/threonine protein kinase
LLVKGGRTQSEHLVLKIVRVEFPETLSQSSLWFGLDHPNISGVIEMGRISRYKFFYVREFFPTRFRLSAEAELASALISLARFFESHSFCHGGLKPNNLYRSNNRLVLTDRPFDRVRLSGFDANSVYTAPELLVGGNYTFESDLYSIGAILYRAFGQVEVFADSDSEALHHKCLYAQPRQLKDVCHVQAELSDAVCWLLDKDPKRRLVGLAMLKRLFTCAAPTPIQGLYVGHENDLERAREFVTNNGTRIAFVSGEKGVGKSRFLAEVCNYSRLLGYTAVQISCNGTESSTPCDLQAAITECSIRLSGQKKSNDWSRLKRLNEKADKETEWPQERRVNDLISFFASTAANRTLIVIDNIESIDSYSKEILRQLVLRASEFDVCLIVSGQKIPKDISDHAIMYLGAQHCLTVHLAVLNTSQAHQLAQFWVRNERALTSITEVAGGNPLLIVNRAKVPANDNGFDRTLALVVDQRILGISKTALELAQMIALFGSPIPTQIIASLYRRDNMDQTMKELESSNIVSRSDDSHVFIPHAVTRCRIYRKMSKSQRFLLHCRSFEILRCHPTLRALAAEQALAGNINEKAAELFLIEAMNSLELEQFRSAADFFARAQIAVEKDGKELALSDRVAYASCVARLGNFAAAKRLYTALLADPGLRSNPDLSATVYERLAVYDFDSTWADRVRYYEAAKHSLDRHSAGWNRVCAGLAHAFVRDGRIKCGFEILEEANIESGSTDVWLLESVKAFALLTSGRFRECISTLRAVRPPNPTAKAGSFNNLALCYEALGDLRKACTYQLRSLRCADQAGHLFARIISHSNLALFNCRLGNLGKANEDFERALAMGKELALDDRSFGKADRLAVHIDYCQLLLEKGKYAQGYDLIARVYDIARKAPDRSSVSALFAYCELNLCLFRYHVVRKMLQEAVNPLLYENPFFRIEYSFLLSRANSVTVDAKLLLLDQILIESQQVGTKYQTCRILIEICETYIEMGLLAEAITHCRRGLLISRRHHYRPLLAHLLLLHGIATANRAHKDRYLSDAVRTAESIGLPELVARASYEMGTFYLEMGDHRLALEYCAKSMSIVSQLAGELKPSLRRSYFEMPWRKDIQNKLILCMRQAVNSSKTIASSRGMKGDGQFVNGLYKIATVSRTADSVDVLTTSLFEALSVTLKRPAAAFLQQGVNACWRSVRLELSPSLRARILALAKTHSTKTHFESATITGSIELIAWIPLSSYEISGGIYVECRGQDDRLSEQEMEYLTVVGTLANSALDRIQAEPPRALQAAPKSDFHGIVGKSRAIKEVCRHIEIAAGNLATVLIEGESGTGKELVARAIHQCGPRAKGPFIPVDCGAIPETLIESELFGSRKGSFTGAVSDRPGLFEAAHGGTIFLDEISNTSPGLQARLLRVIQEREVRRIGETKGRAVDVRLIVATNTNLDTLVQQREFRQDLLFRLKVLHIKVPPLRARREDIPQLVEAFIERLNFTHRSSKYATGGFMDQLSAFEYPGNIRELQNLVERAYLFAKGAAIASAPIEPPVKPATASEIETWFKDLTEGRQEFWSAVYDRYKRRDISREKVVALVDLGLRSTRGNYKALASMFQVKDREYRRFMDFLRRNDCELDFRPYRKPAAQ